MADQMGLFGPDPSAPSAPVEVPQQTRRRRNTRPQRPDVAAEVLDAIHHGRLGVLDDSDRVVVFEDDDRVRLSADEDTVISLLAQRYAERRPPRDTVSCLHGVVRKPVSPLRLTRSGAALRHRWAALRPLT